MLQSCQNCWFNGLQYGALGLPVGYCSRHRKILNTADGTTCGLHMRKDLSLDRARQVARIHAATYPNSVIVRIRDEAQAKTEVSEDERDLDSLRSDGVAEVVTDYGMLDSKIESLAQLKVLAGARAEVAMISLARGYVNNCIARNGSWTSGLHLWWWTKKRLPEIPDIAITDLRATGGIPLSRQATLTAWSIVMLRLTFIDDVVEYAAAENDAVGELKGLLQKAAIAVQTFNLQRLSGWMRREALPILDRQLPYERYRELSRQLHKDSASPGDGSLPAA
jgi:hypothetical protein